MKHIRNRLLAVALAMTLLLSGCSASSKYDYSSGATAESAPQAPMEMPAPENGFGTDYKVEMEEVEATVAEDSAAAENPNTAASENSNTADPLAGKNIKLIWRAELSMETLDFDAMVDGMNNCVADFGGYIESSYVEGGERLAGYKNNRYGDYTIRIPAKNLDAFLNQMGTIGNVLSKSKSSENITLEYADNEARKATLELEEQKLMELLEQATILEDIITLESRLSEVHYRLDGYASTLRKYDDLVDFSTVNVSIREVERMKEVAPETLGQRIANNFSNSLYSVKNFGEDFIVFLIGGSPVLLLWAVIIIVIIFIVRKVLKRRAEFPKKPRKESKLPEAPDYAKVEKNDHKKE